MWGVAKLVVLGVFFCVLWGAEEQLPVSIRGDSLIYQDDKITASGNARLAYAEYEILAEHIAIDTSANRVEGCGKVWISQSGTVIQAEYFLYDINEESIVIREVDTSFDPDFSANRVFVNFHEGANHAPTGLLSMDKWSGQHARFTTCDLAAPHSWLSAKEFLYYPDNKVVAYHLTAHFWFSPLPLLYTPYYVFYTGPRRIVFTFPKIGSNTVEGQFLKTETLYFLDELNEGGVYWDMMSIKGNGSGFWHRYNFGDPGYFSFYQVKEMDTRPEFREPRQSYAINWQQRLSFSAYDRVDLNHRYRKMYLLPQGYDDRMEDSLSYEYNNGADRLNANYNFREDYQANQESQGLQSNFAIGQNTNRTAWQKEYRQADNYRYDALNIDHTYRINQEWNYHINPVYYRSKSADDPYEQRMDLYTDLELNPLEKKYFERMRIYANYYYDLSAEDITKNALEAEFVEKAPEITVRALRYDVLGNDLDSALFSIDHEYSSSWIREAKYFQAYGKRRFFETTKYTANYNFYKTYNVLWSNLTLLKSYNQASYGTQDQHYQTSDRPYWSLDWFGFFRNKLEYEQTQSEGASPFFYDDPAQYRTKRGRHTAGLYWRNYFELTAAAGKDFETNIYDDDMYNLRVDPLGDGLLKFNFSTGQSRYTSLYRDLVGGVQFNKDSNYYRLSFTKDINSSYQYDRVYGTDKDYYATYAGKLKSASSELELSLGRPYEEMESWNFWLSQWQIMIRNTYDFNTEYFNLNTFALGKDLHCWYMRYNFTPVRKEWFVVFTLKAFPAQEFKLSGNEDNEYNFDAFSDTLKATEVKRYD